MANKIIKESIAKQILTELTAFICIDSSKADEITKYHLKNPKESFTIHPMNPADHVLQVSFRPAHNDFDSDSDIYIDECCIADVEMPRADSENSSKPSFPFKITHKNLPFKVINKSAETGVTEFSTMFKFK